MLSILLMGSLEAATITWELRGNPTEAIDIAVAPATAVDLYRVVPETLYALNADGGLWMNQSGGADSGWRYIGFYPGVQEIDDARGLDSLWMWYDDGRSERVRLPTATPGVVVNPDPWTARPEVWSLDANQNAVRTVEGQHYLTTRPQAAHLVYPISWRNRPDAYCAAIANPLPLRVTDFDTLANGRFLVASEASPDRLWVVSQDNAVVYTGCQWMNPGYRVSITNVRSEAVTEGPLRMYYSILDIAAVDAQRVWVLNSKRELMLGRLN